MNPLEAFLSGKDAKGREELLRAANTFMQSEQGRAVMQRIEQDPSLRKKLQEAEAKGISKLSAKDRRTIMESLRGHH